MEKLSFKQDSNSEGEFFSNQKKEEYLRQLKERGEATVSAALDRSKFFRFRKDFEILNAELEEIFAGENKKFNFLDIGVGNMEEPLSFLSNIEHIASKKNLKLEDICDFEMVDIRHKEEIEMKVGLGKRVELGAFLTEEQKGNKEKKPVMPPSGYEDFFDFSEEDGEYQFKEEVQTYLRDKIKDRSKSHLGLPVENFLQDNPLGKYDFVACNNVLQHLGGIEGYRSPIKDRGMPQEEYKKYFDVVAKILESVKPGGVIFMHTPIDMTDNKGRGTADIVENLPIFKDNFEQVAVGVFKRKLVGEI